MIANDDFNFDNVEIVDRCPQWSRRLFLEAWHSIREPNSMHIPEMYKILANPQWILAFLKNV